MLEIDNMSDVDDDDVTCEEGIQSYTHRSAV
jgi:hypothetical protein